MKISVVIPIFNEEENLTLLYEELTQVMTSLDRPYEILFVDDGSKDSSLAILQSLQEDDSKVVVVQFRRNFGQTAAMSAGFDYSSGDVIITMDGDL
ncbi:MAG: glycosyltransferase, partial [Desulfofustis sp.]|nr:glycosyltransferase [Desulfofustis sp.]